MATEGMWSRLPELDDDDDIGVEREHLVPRDDQADLKFSGTLLASVAPSDAPRGRWKEYRVYRTTSGKHVFSSVGRSVLEGERDKFKAEVFSPKSPVAACGQTWDKACIEFFGYDALAKLLYRKLHIAFEERID
jgi:hypothetical protein